MKDIVTFISLIFCLTVVEATAQADLKMKKTVRMDLPGMQAAMKNPMTGETMDVGKLPEELTMIKGPRMLTEMRKETRSPMGTKKYILSTLRQCDRGRELTYTNKSKKYFASYFSAATKQGAKDKPSDSGEGVVTYEMSYKDTGERKTIFGFPARRVKGTVTITPSSNACDKRSMKLDTDSWYIDLPAYSCPTFFAPQSPDSEEDGESSCNDRKIFKVNGVADNGFAVRETMTISLPGYPAMTIISEVTEITRTEFDAKLFDEPAGYTEEKESAKQREAVAANQSDASAIPPGVENKASMTSGINANVSKPEVLAAKKSGTIRIGIAKPKANIQGDKNDPTAPLELSAAVGDSLAEALKSDSVETLRLTTDAPESEAKQKECDYIFYANVTQKRGGGGMFGKMIAMAAISSASVFVPGVGGMIAGTATNVIMGQTMGKIAKAKDEFTFDYKVMDLSNAVIVQSVTKSKTKTDGEDVLTPQIKQASTSVLGEIKKKRAQ